MPILLPDPEIAANIFRIFKIDELLDELVVIFSGSHVRTLTIRLPSRTCFLFLFCQVQP